MFRKPAKPKRLVVIDIGSLSEQHRATMATLQGLLAKKNAETQIFFNDFGSAAPRFLEKLRDDEGITTEQSISIISLANRFADDLEGYILYDRTNPASLNVATALASIENAVVVDQSIENFYADRDLTKVIDVSERDELWLWENYSDQFNRSVVVEQRGDLPDFLRAYAVLHQAFVFYGISEEQRGELFSVLDDDAAVVGWGQPPEDNFIRPSSESGAFTIPADFARNLVVYSSIQKDKLEQKPTEALLPQKDEHYVAFVFTDGDNLQWMLNTFLSDWFDHPRRSDIPLGWGIPPALIDIAPTVMQLLYEKAEGDSNADRFTVGPSGLGYIYPSSYPPSELATHTSRLSQTMQRAGLGIVQIIDFDSFGNTGLWDQYTQQESIDGLIYLEFERYDREDGKILFSNGKPVVAARHVLWEGLMEEDELVDALNNAARNPESAAGYSVVSVHVWTKNISNVADVIDRLDPKVRVVTPDQLLKMIRQNLATDLDRRQYPFEQGAEGWIGETAGGEFDQTQWVAGTGNPPGTLSLDGSDLGIPDEKANARVYRDVKLPEKNAWLSFETRGQADGDGRLRVLLEINGTQTVILDWETLGGDTWIERRASLGDFAGQRVRLIFQHDDSGDGAGEHRYIDNVRITTSANDSWIIQ